MDIEGNWARIKAHRRRLSALEIQGLAEALFRGQEEWLGEKLRRREDQALVLEFLGFQGRGGSPKAVALLLKYLEEREEVLQLAAAAALKNCPPTLVLEPLRQIMLRQNHSSVKAGEVLLALGTEGADSLWNLWFVKGCPGSLKAQVLQLLTEIKDGRCQDLAFLALLSDDEELARTALKAAEKLVMKGLWGNVAGYLKHPSWRLRGRAALLLGSWGEREALPYLREMGEDSDSWVEEEREKAINKITGKAEY